MSQHLVKVLQAGRLSYQQGLNLQKQLVSQHLQSNSNEDTLVLIEHLPVYTIGIRRSGYTNEDELRLQATGAEFFKTNRGGLITFHGLGQLVAYPIINLKHFNPSMRWYVCNLEKTIIDMCRGLSICAETSPHTGVWVKDKKLCAIGIHGSRFITTHGIALNCNTDLSWFSHIVPCGIEDKGVTSLTEELGRKVTIDDAIPLFLQSFSKTFKCLLCNYPKLDTDKLLSVN